MGKSAFLLSLSLTIATAAQSQQAVYNVAIFLYQGVELLDFAGPTEVFASTSGFNVYTVSVDGQDILSQGLLTVKPQYSIDNAPKPDIIVFPGGSSGASSRNEKVLNWARAAANDNRSVMSVCTGAFILARAGLVDDLSVTTHHGSIDALRDALPNATVLENTRFVDNDKIITTAGVSAGIDGALHLVSRIKGMEVAKATAYYMEYDKWHPEAGKTASLNPVLQAMEDEMNGKPAVKTLSANDINDHIPYEGELVDYVTAMNAKGKFQQAAEWLEKAVKWYPNSGALYNQLHVAYVKLQKPVPIDEAGIMKLIDNGNPDQANVEFRRAGKEFPGWKVFGEDAMNLKGYEYLQKSQYEMAIAIFKLNTMAYPESGNVWDSLGEAYMNADNKKEAIANYEKSLQKNPNNTNAKNMLAKLKPE